jgi:hypothetical protein
MKKRLKRISLFLGVVVLGVATSVSLFANSPKDAVGVDATNFTNNDIRIPFVGLSWWDDYDSGEGDTIGNEVFIRIVDSDKESSLTNNTVADIPILVSKVLLLIPTIILAKGALANTIQVMYCSLIYLIPQ